MHMTHRHVVSTPSVASSPYYSQGLRVGELVFVSGQGPWDAAGEVVGKSIEEQTSLTLDNLRTILGLAGATLRDVVKVTAHLSDMKLFEGFNRVYAQYFDEPRPTRTTVGSQLVGIMVEIDCIAVTPGRPPGTG